MLLPASYLNGFAPRDGQPLYPSLWRGCVGAWAPCLGPSGLVLRDWSGAANHGTLTNMEADSDWVTASGRWGLDFDGVNDRIGVARQPSYPMSISVCFSAGSNSRQYHTLYSNDQEITSPRTLMVLYRDSGSTYFLSYYSGTYYHSSGFTLNVGEMCAYTITLTSSGAVVMYRNGIKIGSNAAGIAGTVTASAAWGNSSGLDSLGFGALGKMSFASIHNRVLSANEVQQMYSRVGVMMEMAPRRRSSVQSVVSYSTFRPSVLRGSR